MTVSFYELLSESEDCRISRCISKLEALDRILLDALFVCKTGSESSVPDVFYKLLDLKEQIGKDAETLKKRALSLAVCGLEKSGKTSLIAGLIGDIKLPVYGRAGVRYECGEADGCELHFYPYNEFNSHFKTMLQSVGFAVPEEGFAEMKDALPYFEEWLGALKENNPKLYACVERTAADIKNILILQEDIKTVLGKDEKHSAEESGFAGLNFEIADLRQTVNIESCSSAERMAAARAYALKEAVVKLKALSRMGCGSIEELPGFDSPMIKYEIRNQLSKADIIILNWDVAFAYLPLSVIEIFSEVRDMYGLTLKSKTLVFGSHIDKIGDPDYLEYYKNRLKQDFTAYSIAEPDNIIFGSALRTASQPEAAADNSLSGSALTEKSDKSGENAAKSEDVAELARRFYSVYCRNIENKLAAALDTAEKSVKRLLELFDGDEEARSGRSGFLGRILDAPKEVSGIRQLICANKAERFRGILEDIERFRADIYNSAGQAESEAITFKELADD